MLFAPPPARLRVGKIWKHTDAGPDRVLVICTLRCLTIEITLAPLRINRELLVNFDPGIDNTYYMKPHLAQLCKEISRIGKTRLIPGEHAIPIKRVDIQIDGIAG